MKYFVLMNLLTFSTNLLAKDVKDFNKVLIQNVQKDINNDNDFAFRKSEGRKPASVEESVVDERKIQEEKKIDRMNNRHFGPNKW
jgi:hypothetical protein